MERVSFHGRVAAFLLDLFLFAVAAHVAVGIDLAVYQTANTGYFGAITWVGFFAALLTVFGLEVLLGRSPGKRLLGLTVAADDGRPAPRGVHLKRAAFKFAPVFMLLFPVLAFAAADPGGPVNAAGTAGDGLWAVTVVDAVVAVAVTLFVIVGCFFAMGQSRQAFHDRF